MGVPVTDLSPAGLVDKLVHRRRGGYCFEQNNLMRYALTELGFGVEPLMGRVVWLDPAGLDGPPHPETHQTLAVRIPDVDGRYLVDVGFGGQTLTSPIRFVTGPVQQTRHEPYRLRSAGRGYVLEALLADVWRPLYVFTDEPRPLIDMEVGSWYVSTHPRSKFVGGLRAALVSDDARWNLRGRNLTIRRNGGGAERIRFDTAAEVLQALERFGIDLSGVAGATTRIGQVLDS